jgi:hypothetical protein
MPDSAKLYVRTLMDHLFVQRKQHKLMSLFLDEVAKKEADCYSADTSPEFRRNSMRTMLCLQIFRPFSGCYLAIFESFSYDSGEIPPELRRSQCGVPALYIVVSYASIKLKKGFILNCRKDDFLPYLMQSRASYMLSFVLYEQKRFEDVLRVFYKMIELKKHEEILIEQITIFMQSLYQMVTTQP